jgi:hypothetical protein
VEFLFAGAVVRGRVRVEGSARNGGAAGPKKTPDALETLKNKASGLAAAEVVIPVLKELFGGSAAQTQAV